MALLRSSACLGLFVILCVARAEADGLDNYIYNYLGRSDTVTIGAGDASRANLAIQHPTPWPHYVNDTDISTSSKIGISAMEKMFQRYEGQGSAPAASSIESLSRLAPGGSGQGSSD